MKRNKRGISIMLLVILIVIITILSTVIITDIIEKKTFIRAKQVIAERRIKELEYAISEISSDYQMLTEEDVTIRNMTLKEYILERLRQEYNLSQSEEDALVIDENGEIIVE